MTTEENKTTTFKNVAGLDEEKDELKEIVDFLKTPKIYSGRSQNTQGYYSYIPGTGKTLLQKRLPEKREFLSFQSPGLILWKCLLVLVHRE